MNQALYNVVANDLLEGMASGRYPVGSLLPTELELCEQFAVSRHTVRAAITQLQHQGLVSRRKRVGTRVEAPPACGYTHALQSMEDLAHLAETQTREIRETEQLVADRELARRLGLEPGGRYWRISSVRIDNQQRGAPLCWTDVYYDERYDLIHALAEANPGQLIASLIERHYGQRVEEVEQEVRAVLLTPELGERLKAPTGSPALRILRQYRGNRGELLVASVTTHPDDRFTFTLKVKRSS